MPKKKPLAIGTVKATKTKKKASGYYTRAEKATWGVACNEDVKGLLWIGKGKEKAGLLLSHLLPHDIASIKKALYRGRKNRQGCFWINCRDRIITLQVHTPMSNHTKQLDY